MKVIKGFFWGGSPKKPSATNLDKLKTDVAEFGRLTEDVSKLPSSTSSKRQAHQQLKHLELVRQCASGLYETLRGGFQCDCREPHPAHIEIDTWSLQAESVDAAVLRFSILLADSTENKAMHREMVAKVEADGTPTNHPMVPSAFQSLYLLACRISSANQLQLIRRTKVYLAGM